MSKFTPGPWTDRGYSDGDIYGNWPEDGEYHQPIIECDSGVYGPYNADRTLILAAPDMYAALGRESERPAKARDMMEREGFVIDNLDDRWQKLAFSLYTMLVEGASDSDAALAKAEGRE